MLCQVRLYQVRLCPGEEWGSIGAVCARNNTLNLLQSLEGTVRLGEDIEQCSTDVDREESRPEGFTIGNTSIEVLEDCKEGLDEVDRGLMQEGEGVVH